VILGGDISANCDCRYNLSAAHNYGVDIEQVMFVDWFSTGHDYSYSLSVGYGFMTGFTAGRDCRTDL
jgi:hypothetical protein